MTGRGDITAAGGPAGQGSAMHVPVMLDEVIIHLAPAAGETFIDGTFGAGGYSRAILDRGANVIGIDRDQSAIAAGAGLVSSANGRLTLVEGRFSELDSIAAQFGVRAADGVVLDIGVSSMQIDQADRGFSFMRDGPLDMRMGKDGPSAADVVNIMEPRDIARILSVLGEEKKAGLIARAIAKRRTEQDFTRTGELAALVEKAIGRRPTDPIHPATRTFQALRIYINEELSELALALGAAERILKAGGRLVIVAFHSLEDRIVKRFLTERSRTRPTGSRHAPAQEIAPPTFTLIERGAVAPGSAEVFANPRARSAKLRAAIRTAAAARAIDFADLGVPNLPLLKPSRA